MESFKNCLFLRRRWFVVEVVDNREASALKFKVNYDPEGGGAGGGRRLRRGGGGGGGPEDGRKTKAGRLERER